VGIGTAAPAAKLHARWNNAELLQLENTNALNPGINVRTFFKTGFFYTGAIGTTGTGSLAARMSFFTGVVSTSSALIEKMSILSNGYVGINTINPVSRLEVNGKTVLRPGGDNAAVEITGNIRVSGSNSPAFVVTCPADGSSFEIDHPSCNGDPNALLFITAASGGYANYSVEYNAGTQKWKIVTYGYMLTGKFTYNLKDCSDNCIPVYAAYAGASIIIKDQKFNVLVIKR
jgi:hypothetical protein